MDLYSNVNIILVVGKRFFFFFVYLYTYLLFKATQNILRPRNDSNVYIRIRTSIGNSLFRTKSDELYEDIL